MVLQSLLGVESKPRISDLVNRIRSLIQLGLNDELVRKIELILKSIELRFRTYDAQAELLSLKGIAWIPTNKGLKKPDEPYVNLPELTKLVGDVAAYVSYSNRYGNIETYLGIRTTAKPDDVALYLLNLCQQKTVLDPKVYEDLYAYLARNFYQISWEIRKRLQQTEVVLLPDKKVFVKAENAYLTDRSRIFGDYRGYVKFIRTFKVPQQRLYLIGELICRWFRFPFGQA